MPQNPRARTRVGRHACFTSLVACTYLSPGPLSVDFFRPLVIMATTIGSHFRAVICYCCEVIVICVVLIVFGIFGEITVARKRY